MAILFLIASNQEKYNERLSQNSQAFKDFNRNLCENCKNANKFLIAIYKNDVKLSTSKFSVHSHGLLYSSQLKIPPKLYLS